MGVTAGHAFLSLRFSRSRASTRASAPRSLAEMRCRRVVTEAIVSHPGSGGARRVAPSRSASSRLSKHLGAVPADVGRGRGWLLPLARRERRRGRLRYKRKRCSGAVSAPVSGQATTEARTPPLQGGRCSGAVSAPDSGHARTEARTPPLQVLRLLAKRERRRGRLRYKGGVVAEPSRRCSGAVSAPVSGQARTEAGRPRYKGRRERRRGRLRYKGEAVAGEAAELRLDSMGSLDVLGTRVGRLSLKTSRAGVEGLLQILGIY